MGHVTYTIYGSGDDARVGITFPSTPSLSIEELDELIMDLNEIHAKLRARTAE